MSQRSLFPGAVQNVHQKLGKKFFLETILNELHYNEIFETFNI